MTNPPKDPSYAPLYTSGRRPDGTPYMTWTVDDDDLWFEGPALVMDPADHPELFGPDEDWSPPAPGSSDSDVMEVSEDDVSECELPHATMDLEKELFGSDNDEEATQPLVVPTEQSQGILETMKEMGNAAKDDKFAEAELAPAPPPMPGTIRRRRAKAISVTRTRSATLPTDSFDSPSTAESASQVESMKSSQSGSRAASGQKRTLEDKENKEDAKKSKRDQEHDEDMA